MAVMGHHGPLLPLYFAERLLMTDHIKYLQLKYIGNYLYHTFMTIK